MSNRNINTVNPPIIIEERLRVSFICFSRCCKSVCTRSSIALMRICSCSFKRTLRLARLSAVSDSIRVCSLCFLTTSRFSEYNLVVVVRCDCSFFLNKPKNPPFLFGSCVLSYAMTGTARLFLRVTLIVHQTIGRC